MPLNWTNWCTRISVNMLFRSVKVEKWVKKAIVLKKRGKINHVSIGSYVREKRQKSWIKTQTVWKRKISSVQVEADLDKT